VITVVNKRYFKGKGIYIGRPSLLGNPFIVGRNGSLDEVMRKYEEYLLAALRSSKRIAAAFEKIKEAAREGDVNLICWCAPKRCHGNIIKRIVEEANAEIQT